MPALNAESQRPGRDPPYEDRVDAWAMPLGTIAGIQLQLSYSVFVAFAVLAGMIAMVRGRIGNTDLPLVALIGSAFWVCGWFAQVLVHCYFRRAARLRIETLTIGLLGVESPPRRWTARSAFLVTSTAILGTVTLGAMLVVAESLVIGPRSWQSMLSVWTAPGFGLLSKDIVWLAGAWLCAIQAICQSFPLPKSLGRVWLVSLIALLAAGEERTTQAAIAQRLLRVIAAATAVVALASIGRDPNSAIPRWAMLMLLAVGLWITSRGSDLDRMLIGFDSNLETGSELETDARSGSGQLKRPSFWSRATQPIRAIRFRRKARQALHRERGEAVDAAQLDRVLDQLHQRGIDSLSNRDRELLNRVSRALRRQRELDGVDSFGRGPQDTE